MKHITLLTVAASLTLSAFLVLLTAGLVSMPVFLGSFVLWIGLITVYSYTPQHRSWLPRTAKARLERIEAQAAGRKNTLPLAA